MKIWNKPRKTSWTITDCEYFYFFLEGELVHPKQSCKSGADEFLACLRHSLFQVGKPVSEERSFQLKRVNFTETRREFH